MAYMQYMPTCHKMKVSKNMLEKYKDTFQLWVRSTVNMKLDCNFHAPLYEIECTERAAQASKLAHCIFKRGHSDAVEASHNVLMRFRSKDITIYGRVGQNHP